MAAAVQGAAASPPLEVVPEELPLVLPPDELPLPEVPLELPDEPPLLEPLLLVLPLLLVDPPSPKFVEVLLEQPVAYSVIGKATNATSPKAAFNFTAYLPWQRLLACFPVLANGAHTSSARSRSTQTPCSMLHIKASRSYEPRSSRRLLRPLRVRRRPRPFETR